MDDQKAWDRFFQLYAPLIKNFARSKGCAPSIEDDILQLTFVKLIKLLPDFIYEPERGKFRTYLHTLVKRGVIDSQRRNRRTIPHHRTRSFSE